ncbi:uncharacterized protein J4E92_005976 [Alternaria infectoria]|uniref:uncharacterized protein n=1 Tax=Alternaria infectoria TaxID=45303 RepID=UPI002220D30E|nr:uncharacterized protein J4E92_005976 [Alternaria infectoria]KAI4926816.1 hypothetical protein J4E92_005976 [Alternaria infectoria]
MFSKPFKFRNLGGRSRRRESGVVDPLLLPDQEDDVRSSTTPSPSQMSASPTHMALTGGQDPGALGLNVVYTPDNGHKADIVFIHGLGGSSRMTWSKHKSPGLFWPLTFLPLEPDICLARILSFGYDADFTNGGNATNVILDFAKTLLYNLKYYTDVQGENLNMGQAYMQGQNDPEYENIVKAISAIIFLSTPHRGTNLANVLNRILQSTPVTNSKPFISELTRNSSTLQKLNEQFRHIAPKLKIVSFYETQPTSIGLKSARVMVLERDSSLLGYPGETSNPLNADHHGVCKYESPHDPNYITVRNVLKSLVSKSISKSQSGSQSAPRRRRSRDLKAILAIAEFPNTDYIFFRDQWVQGTNQWIHGEKRFVDWLNPHISSHQILWLKGAAARGKSVLSSFIINSLIERDFCCQYFFVRFADRRKRTLSFLLRSIAYQIAQQLPEFLQKIAEVESEAVDFEAANPRTIWDRIFRSILFKLSPGKTLYWVIDGLDEADNPKALIDLLSDVAGSATPIRALLVSRDTTEIAAGLEHTPNTVFQETITIEGHVDDLRCYIDRELILHGSKGFRDDIIQRILHEAQDNFLWVRLAVEKINSCHTHSAVEQAFHEFPRGMEAIYDRMAVTIAGHQSSADTALASAVLQCVTCAFRALTIEELLQALEGDAHEFLDIQDSIKNVCSGFVVIDNDGNVAMIHETAREYLLGADRRPFQVDRRQAHEQLFLSCMRYLMSSGLRPKLNHGVPDFASYSSNWWSSHLAAVPAGSEAVASVINKFLTGHYVLTWIHILATELRLRILIQASKNLLGYVNKRKSQLPASIGKRDVVELEQAEAWAVDFVKIIGKFGAILRRNPPTIHKTIAPFCPHNSAIYQQFGRTEQRSLMVSGISTQTWDDSLARLSFGFGTYASFISTAGNYVAVLAASGKASLFDTSLFEETATSPIRHGERTYMMKLNSSGTLLVTYGYNTTKIWVISTGDCIATVANPATRSRPLVIAFVNNNRTLLVGSDDKQLRSLEINEPSPTWDLVANFEEEELEGHFLNAASYMALSGDGSLMAVAYRGHPLSAWEVEGPYHIGHCWRARKEVARGEVAAAKWLPHSPQVLGLYNDGVVFRWDPYGGEPEEIFTGASILTVSGDGNLFATGDVRGAIKIYTTSTFHLIYQLASQDAILGLAFSADHRRIYDVRGYYGNTWEPAALVRYAESAIKGTDTEGESESSSQESITPVHTSRRIDAITVLAASPNGQYYCYGTESGRVMLCNTKEVEATELHTSKGFLSIEQAAWSDDGRYICFADSGKKVFVMVMSRRNASGSGSVAQHLFEVSLKTLTDGSIQQLLFQPDSSRLFVATSATLCTMSLQLASVVRSVPAPEHDCKWIAHPQDPALILGFGQNSVVMLSWDLDDRGTYRIERSLEPDTSAISDQEAAARTVERILITSDKLHILVQMSRSTESKLKEFLYFATSSFSTSASVETQPEMAGDHRQIVVPMPLPDEMASQIGKISFVPAEWRGRSGEMLKLQLSMYG